MSKQKKSNPDWITFFKKSKRPIRAIYENELRLHLIRQFIRNPLLY